MITALFLTREPSSEHGTFGTLVADDSKLLSQTLELPWRDNAHGISCIPAGEYTATLRMSAKHNCLLWHVENVPGRTEIEVHSGNSIADTEGCILVGDERDGWRIIDSKDALARVMAYVQPATKLKFVVRDL